MREMIVNRNAKFAAFENKIHTLKLRLSKNIEDNKTLTTTMDVLKKETKEKEDKYIEEIVDLEKQKNDLDYIVYKVDKKYLRFKRNNFFLENDRLLELIISQDLVHTAVNSYAAIVDYVNMEKIYLDEYNECLELKAELLKKNEMSNCPWNVQIRFITSLSTFRKNKEVHEDYLKVTKEHADTLRGIVKQDRDLEPSDNELDYAYMNSKFVCSTCNDCLFFANHDKCVVAYLNDVNARVKSKPGKSIKKECKSTGKVFTSVGHRWLPTGRTFTIDGTKCPMTRITSTKVAPHRKSILIAVITKIPSSSASNRKPKVTKSVSSSMEPSILGPMASNNSKPNKN
ncbi:hypothetical protein Tco_1385000 [Tanacetum coccineum]